MAVTSGTVHSVTILKSRSVSESQLAEVLFTMSGTYTQAENSILTGVAALIQNSTRNGRTVTMLGVAPGQAASIQTDGTAMGIKTCAIATDDVTFELTTSNLTTEFANATAIPSQARPFGLLVAFKES